ncbi:MAG: glycine zipper 2TM domain-containing protein, partial [Rhodospirillales bacterium]|nr:glycine zipper 2TM domain-containing protein [Rhodospirillales bacterium]
MKSPKLALIVITTLFLSACQTNGVGPKQQFGTLAGAGLGALAGANMGKGRGRLATVALGALGGAYLGSEIGRSL